MKTDRMSEETKEKVMYGCFFGLVLFASSAVYFSFIKDTAAAGELLKFVPAALVIYLILGNLFIWLYNRPENKKAGVWFNGSAAVYWIWLLMGALAFIAFFLPSILRHMILVNVAVAVVCWIVDYRSFHRIADELNGGVVKGRYLVVDIQECPKSVEAFCREIEDYCKKSRIRLEFVTRGKPAVVKMDGELYHVELDSFYSQFGPMYALKFRQDYQKQGGL